MYTIYSRNTRYNNNIIVFSIALSVRYFTNVQSMKYFNSGLVARSKVKVIASNTELPLNKINT